MEYDLQKVDDAVLALLHLVSFKDPTGIRAWKSQDWDVMNRLHEKGFISDPRTRARSVVLTEDGAEKAEMLCRRFFARDAEKA